MAKILISIDHKWRDLPIYVYIGRMLNKMQHKVYYCRSDLEEIFVSCLRPDLILMIHLLDKKKQELVKHFKRSGINVVLLPTEGIPTLSNHRRFAAGVYNDLSGVDISFVWNKTMAGILGENKSINSKKICVVGVPRFDFYREPLLQLLMPKCDFLDKYQFKYNYPLVTFATNFTQASFHIKNKEFQEKDAKKFGYDKLLDINEMTKRDYESREFLVKNFINLLKDFPKVNFVLKLHPSEDHVYYFDMYKKQLSEYHDRLKLITKEYIWNILNATDIELSRSCTTAIESWLLNKPTIEMKLNPDEWYFSEEHASGSDVVTSYDMLKKKIEYYLSGGKISNEKLAKRENFISKWCCVVDGLSTNRLVSKIDELLRNKKSKVKMKFNLKNKTLYHLISSFNYKLHDAKVYGFKGLFLNGKIDKLDRIDKFFNNKDIKLWENKFDSIF